MPDYKQLIRKKSSAKSSKQNNVSPRIKKFPRSIVVLLVIPALIVCLFFSARHFLLHFSILKISKVSIVDTKGKPLGNTEGIFRLEEEANLFNFNMKRVAQDIQARHPEFANVLIRKQFPHTLAIVVKKREPFAIVATKGASLVDEEGFILPYESTYEQLPKIIGIHPRQIGLYTKSRSLRLKKALNLLKELKKAKIYPEYKVSQIDIKEYADVVFYLENGIEVKMGNSDFGRKSLVLIEILTQLKTSDTVPKYIDMRFESPTVMPR